MNSRAEQFIAAFPDYVYAGDIITAKQQECVQEMGPVNWLRELVFAVRRYRLAHAAIDASGIEPTEVDCMSTDEEIALVEELRNSESHLLRVYDE